MIALVTIHYICTENFPFADDGPLHSYLGVYIVKHNNGSFELYQTFLIDKIIKKIICNEILHGSNVHESKELLHKNADGPDRKHEFNNWQAVGMMLTYLQGTTRFDIATPAYQYTRFSSNSKHSLEKSFIFIISKAQRMKESSSSQIKLTSGWWPDDGDNVSNLLSRTGYII